MQRVNQYHNPEMTNETEKYLTDVYSSVLFLFLFYMQDNSQNFYTSSGAVSLGTRPEFFY